MAHFNFGDNPAWMTEPVKCKGWCKKYVDRSGRGRDASFQRSGFSFCRRCVFIFDDMRERGVSAFCADCDACLATAGYTEQADGRWICSGCVRGLYEQRRERGKLERAGQAGLFAAPDVEVKSGRVAAVVVVAPVFEPVEVQGSLF